MSSSPNENGVGSCRARRRIFPFRLGRQSVKMTGFWADSHWQYFVGAFGASILDRRENTRLPMPETHFACYGGVELG